MAGSSGSSGSATGGAGTGGGAEIERAGLLEVEFVLASATGTPAYTSVGGRIYDGLVPPDRYWNVAGEASGCTLYTPRPILCDPACSAAEACVLQGGNATCASQPGAHDAGTLTVSGLRTADGSTTFSIEPTLSTDGTIVTYQSPTLPEKAADDGAPVRIETPAGSTDPFLLEALAVLPLELAEGSVAVEAGSPVSLSWVPAPSGSARLQIKLDISHHGGSKGKIECDVADSGSFDIPAALITDLVALGVAGYPTIQVARATSGRASIAAGPIELLVFSGAERPVVVPGVTSCMANEECPAGQSCDFQNFTCAAL